MISEGMYASEELGWGFMFEDDSQLLAVRSEFIRSDGKSNMTFIKAHAEVSNYISCTFCHTDHTMYPTYYMCPALHHMYPTHYMCPTLHYMCPTHYMCPALHYMCPALHYMCPPYTTCAPPYTTCAPPYTTCAPPYTTCIGGKIIQSKGFWQSLDSYRQGDACCLLQEQCYKRKIQEGGTG